MRGPGAGRLRRLQHNRQPGGDQAVGHAGAQRGGARHRGADHAARQGTLVVKQPAGDVSVAYSASTNVLQTSGATQANILAGACVVVTGQRQAAGDVTANMVQVQFNMNGNCTPPAGVAPGGVGPGNAVNLRGKITSVGAGATFAMEPVTAPGTQVTVNVPATAVITRLDTASTSRLAVGQCVRVNGQPGAAGVVQARALVITPAGPSGCPGPAGGGQTRPSGSPSPGA